MAAYSGNLAKVSFTVKFEDDHKVVELYADNRHFYTQKFDADVPHQEIVAKCYADIFGGK